MIKSEVCIVGAGLCGTLLATYLAQQGIETTIIEKRPDPRKVVQDGNRSINLALSDRGLEALDLVGMAAEVRAISIPMYARLIHFVDGGERNSPYSGRQDDYINSISREELNVLMLDKADEHEHINFHFEWKCNSVDEENGVVHCSNTTGESKEIQAQMIFGTDGAGSAVRRAMFATGTKHLMNYSQDFLRHGYKELELYAEPQNMWKIEKNALHIWPRGSHMVIALPNLDGSFTVTCFFPFKGNNSFETFRNTDKLIDFFQREFKEVLDIIPDLAQQFKQNPTGVLGTIKCYPHAYSDKLLLMGDAAHAVVPFYGQGMNASFEDVHVLADLMQVHGSDWKNLIQAYNAVRPKQTNAIADLALDNFYEMSSHTADPNFIKKRELEMELESNYPDYYSKYSLVTFRPDLSYDVAMRRGRAQDDCLLKYCAAHAETNAADAYQLIKDEVWKNEHA